ncbi:uncharacterized protein TRAVEDRAFT_51716 [Trametes versicolor FP-101664 SS1]|uniref:uncharacterized protein n=1 Tax=Trametes versicolor (strain FP-101664) TaxID=717944 RepID=UPI0004622A0F|nr:uncharacterized protein TRAVEDRAFT_51716 [Trametes versicolor FP-101664 SS1]EIW53980.1 hypothetical protein TRAVEDRAFT_51716 [Trametes versicolor FP-101664 SS1]
MHALDGAIIHDIWNGAGPHDDKPVGFAPEDFISGAEVSLPKPPNNYRQCVRCMECFDPADNGPLAPSTQPSTSRAAAQADSTFQGYIPPTILFVSTTSARHLSHRTVEYYLSSQGTRLAFIPFDQEMEEVFWEDPEASMHRAFAEAVNASGIAPNFTAASFKDEGANVSGPYHTANPRPVPGLSARALHPAAIQPPDQDLNHDDDPTTPLFERLDVLDELEHTPEIEKERYEVRNRLIVMVAWCAGPDYWERYWRALGFSRPLRPRPEGVESLGYMDYQDEEDVGVYVAPVRETPALSEVKVEEAHALEFDSVEDEDLVRVEAILERGALRQRIHGIYCIHESMDTAVQHILKDSEGIKDLPILYRQIVDHLKDIQERSWSPRPTAPIPIPVSPRYPRVIYAHIYK